MIIVNTKNYKSGKALLKLARLIHSYNSRIVVAVPPTEIYQISKIKLKVYSQHVDFTDKKSTGFVSICDIKSAGASGTLLNHSEHPLAFKVLNKTVVECKKHKLKTIICAANLKDVKKFIKLKPEAIAFEDPKLVGSGKSITFYEPVEILKFVHMLRKSKILPLCGAGISSVQDVKAAYNLGCKGVLISSAIANSNKSRSFLRALRP
jgi:triosephosphate isomerase